MKLTKAQRTAYEALRDFTANSNHGGLDIGDCEQLPFMILDKLWLNATGFYASGFDGGICRIQTYSIDKRDLTILYRKARRADETFNIWVTNRGVEAIKLLARQYIAKNIDADEWSEDDWVSLDANNDLNVYIDDDGEHRATIFPVINGQTNLEIFTKLI